jgi:uncharacterized protein DUF4864
MIALRSRLIQLAAGLAVGFFVALLPGMPWAAETGVSVADSQAIHDVIAGQIDAFRHDDGARAFSYASPTIQEKFGNADFFMQMVKTGYTQVYRAHDVQFQGLDMEAGAPVQRVRMIGPDGLPVIVIYMMQRQPDGSWKINGVFMTTSDDLST